MEALWRSSHGWMVRLAWLIRGDEPSAEDAVSEAWLRCLDRLDGLERPEGYLRTTLVRLCLDERRRTAARRRLVEVEPGVPVVDVGLVDLADALAALPRQQRAAVVLRFVHDADDDEIAEALGARRSTVRSHVRHGLVHLRGSIS